MNTTEICQTRQPWHCDQQSFSKPAVILEFKGILRQIYVGHAVRSLSGSRRVGAPCGPPSLHCPADPLGDLPYPS